MVMCALACLCMCACGGEGSTEDTVDITSPTEVTAAPADNRDIAKDAKSESSSEEGDGTESDVNAGRDASSEYAKIYNDCNTKMKKATSKYVGELNEQASSISKNDLYDETQDRIEKLKKIYDDGKGQMVDAMLASTKDDELTYKYYFGKLTESYTELSREITSAYTDAF